MKLHFPNYFMLFIILNMIIHFLIPLKQVILKYNYFGVFFIIIGIYFYLSVYAIFKKEKINWRQSASPSKLIKCGVFKISRNPMYLGMFLILLGEAVILGSLGSFILPFLFLIGTDYELHNDEYKLKKKFGKEYKEYNMKVRRWI